MTAEEINVKVAELCGWSVVKDYGFGRLYGYPHRTPSYDIAECPPAAIPNYHASLDAIHEAEKTLTGNEPEDYWDEVASGIQSNKGMFAVIHADAPTRCRAFLAVKGVKL